MSKSTHPQKLSSFKRLRYFLFPAKSRREYFLWQGVTAYRNKGPVGLLRFLKELVLIAIKKLEKVIFPPIGPFAIQYNTEDNSQVTVFADGDIFANYPHRQNLSGPIQRRVAVSLIATLRNEQESATGWLESLARQTRLPDEVVLVDGGSTDGTLELLQEFAAHSPFPVIIISEPGANVARGRNIAVAHAKNEIIACTDFGCQLHPDWLQNLIVPFERDPEMQVVAGWYLVRRSGRARMIMLGPQLNELDPQGFSPSSRSLALTKTAWEKAGGNPEWLTITGEDTLFNLELKRCCTNWAFVPQAIVEWQGPKTTRSYWRKIYFWSMGDGESGVDADRYWHSLLRVGLIGGTTVALLIVAIAAALLGWLAGWLALVLWIVGTSLIWFLGFSGNLRSFRDLFIETGAEIARFSGFLLGVKHRPAIWTQRFRDLHGVFFILSGVPIDDTGGGARCTQLSLELLRQGYAVVFINKYPKYESVHLKLNLNHPNLITSALSDFNWERFLKQYSLLLEGRPLAALVEFPLGDFLPLIEHIRSRGGVVAYDLLDAWDTSLGGQWYSPETEMKVIVASQVLIATEASLADRLRRMSDRQVTLLPNAVNTRLFDPAQSYPRPTDFPEGDWVILFIGAMWGEWFDWDLLTRCALGYPEAAVVAIGDYRGQCANPPPNLFFLGLKPQRALPAYLAQADVAIIPWKVSPVTQATSPLKVYEYIAMRKPVVAPDLLPLYGLPGVFPTPNQDAFIRMVGQARGIEVPEQDIADFISANNWQARVGVILEQIRQYDVPKQ
jgi:glycosyltransferase involved in cell wall biosynthesis